MVKAELIQGSMNPLPKKNWLFSVTGKNWEILKAENVWAVRSQNLTEKISEGDKLIFHVKGSTPPSLMGIYEVTGSWRRSSKPRWSEERESGQVIYGWEVDVKPIRFGTVNIEGHHPS